MKTKHRFSPAVRGSEDVALKLLVWGEKHLGMSLHYCPSYIKDAVQLRKRFLRTAKNIRKPYQVVDVDGLLVFGVVAGSAGDRKEIVRKLRLKPRLIEAVARGKLYTSVAVAERLSKKGYRCWIEKIYPTADETLIELEPI